MDDLISRQAMLDGIDKLIKIHFDRIVVLYKARKVAEDLPPAQPEQRWIPVSERLPDIDENVLVSDGTWIWKDCLEVRYGKAQWYHNETLEGTAWMPLPEPCQEGGEHK